MKILRFHRYLLAVFLCIQVNVVYAQPQLKEALKAFGDCLCANRNQLEVRDLRDFYRVRGIPAKCCQALATNLLPSDITRLVKGIDTSNCRINAMFSPNIPYDPHNHPLHFVSYVVSGGYTHTIFNKKNNVVDNKTDNTHSPCVPNLHQVCAEHSRIDTKTDTIQKLGTVKLTRSHEESFAKGDLIVYNDTNIIHRPDTNVADTLTINFLSDIGDKKIDVFVSHKTPEREKVLSKADTRQPVKKEISSDLIDKCIMILKSESTKIVGSSR